MPILLVLFLVAASAPVAWPAPPFDWGARAATTLMLVSLSLALAAHFALAHWATFMLRRDPADRGFVAEKYSRLRRLIGLAHFALSIIAIALGWGWTVQQRFVIPNGDHLELAPFAELLVPLPYLIGVFLGWIIHHDAERALHLAGADANSSFWSRRGHFTYKLRQYLLLVLLPVLLVAGQQTLSRFDPETAQSLAMKILAVCLMPLVLLLMPLLAKLAFGWQSLPLGRQRDRFEATAKRLNFHCSDLLIWPTHRTIGGAMVLGLVPRVQYVVFTDRLLDALDDDELEAVFGHEIGHVKHHHLIYYAAFLVLSMVVVSLGTSSVLAALCERGGGEPAIDVQSNWMVLPTLAAFAGYLFLVFGLVSRKCERQADLYGVRTVASGRSEGHPQAAGVYAMTRALEKVAVLNGLESSFGEGNASRVQRWKALLLAWTHGSIPNRIDFLHRILEEPGLESRVQRRITLFRIAILLALILSLALLGSWLGWAQLAEMI